MNPSDHRAVVAGIRTALLQAAGALRVVDATATVVDWSALSDGQVDKITRLAANYCVGNHSKSYVKREIARIATTTEDNAARIVGELCSAARILMELSKDSGGPR